MKWRIAFSCTPCIGAIVVCNVLWQIFYAYRRCTPMGEARALSRYKWHNYGQLIGNQDSNIENDIGRWMWVSFALKCNNNFWLINLCFIRQMLPPRADPIANLVCTKGGQLLVRSGPNIYMPLNMQRPHLSVYIISWSPATETHAINNGA